MEKQIYKYRQLREENNLIYSMEIGKNLRYINEDRTGKYFIEWDVIDCYIKNGKQYTGKIAGIGFFRENRTENLEPVVQLDTSESDTSYSGEIIFVKDIIYISNKYKNTVDELQNKKLDKESFINIFIKAGYEEKFAKIVYDKMLPIIAIYKIPTLKAAECALYALKYQCDIKELLKDKCNITFETEELS